MQRSYVAKDFRVTTWDLLKPYYDELQKRSIGSVNELEKWLKDYSELSAVVNEDMGWRYIRMTCDTEKTALRDSYNDFVQNIEPNIAPIANELNKKIVALPYCDSLTAPGYSIMLKGIKNAIELFREENIPLNTKLQEMEQEFGAIDRKSVV